MANRTGYKSTTSFEEAIAGADFCEHVTADTLHKAVGYFWERDSFGLVSASIVCQPCREESLKQIQEAPVCCIDCGMTVKKKDSIEWVPYDFYPNQGDVAITICNGCLGNSKHKARIRQDAEEYAAEFGHGDDDERSPWLR